MKGGKAMGEGKECGKYGKTELISMDVLLCNEITETMQ
jgi:hypothetical protein